MRLVLFLALSIYSFATTVDHKIAAKFARDAYIDKIEFAKKYKKSNNSISTAVVNGVRFFIIEDKTNTLVIVRGTDNMRNVVTDVMAKEVNFLDDEFILVHQGFYDISKRLFKKIKLNTKKPVVVIGHSLGGAVSLLYGTILKEKGLDVTIYTFGMPPVVNKFFLKKYKNVEHYRHYHIFDPIPTLSKPTIQVFQTQVKLKTFQHAKDTINNMIKTIKHIPDKYRHHGFTNTITDKLNITKERLNESLFFKTCTLYFDYHKIDNYFKALESKKSVTLSSNSYSSKSSVKAQKKANKPITVIPSVLKGTSPLDVEFYINNNDNDIKLYYFNFAGKEILKKDIKNNKIAFRFGRAGKHKVMIALKDSNNKISNFEFIVQTREPTFKEYAEMVSEDFDKFLKYN